MVDHLAVLPYALCTMLRSRTTLVVGVLAATVAISLVLAAGLSGRQTYRYLSVFEEVWNLTRANYVETVSEDSLLEGAYRGMLSSLDAASAYLAPSEEDSVLAPPGPGRTGLEVLPSGGIPIVVRVDPGSPADRAGVRAGDQIWRIAGASARQLSWPQLTQRLTGAVGQKLALAILDGRSFRVRTVDLQLEAPQGAGFSLDQAAGGIAHLRLRTLDRLDPAQLTARVKAALRDPKTSALLIDLRGAVGLDLAGIARAAAPLLPEGETWRLERRDGVSTAIEVPAVDRPALPRQLFVLVDGSTAGTAEALAVALKERAGAVICGRETYGLGALPEVIPLSRGGSVLLTTRAMISIEGTRWAGDGLGPDHEITLSVARADDREQDRMLDEALAWIRAGAPRAEKQPAAAKGPSASLLSPATTTSGRFTATA